MIHVHTCGKCGNKFHTGCFDSKARYEYEPAITEVELSQRVLQLATYKVTILCDACL